MRKFVLLGVSTVALFMAHAQAVQFDLENLSSEDNKRLAYKLYRGAYKTLENEPKGVSSEAKEAIEKKRLELQYPSYDEQQEYKTSQFWGSVVGNKYRDSDAQRAHQLGMRITSMHVNNDRVEEELRKLEVEGTYLPNLRVGYIKVQNLKKAAQELFNAYDSKKDETIVRTQLLTVQDFLNGFDKQVISKILEHSDAQ